MLQFGDPEELSLALREADVRAIQTRRGAFSAVLSYVQLGDWSLQQIDFLKGAAACAGCGPANRYAFVVPLKVQGHCRLLGKDVTGSSIGAYAHGSEHADTSSDGYSQIVLMTPPGFVPNAASCVNGLKLPDRGSHHLSLSEHAVESLRFLLRRAMANGRAPPSAITNQELNRSFNDELSSAVKKAIASRDISNEKGRPALPRATVMRHLSELLDLQRGQPTYVGELAKAIGVSDATLRRMFIELFGMPPARYLIIKRLYLARQALRSGQFETVGQVADACGFWDQSRFPGRYRSIFNELPVDTLRKSRKVTS